MRSVTRCDRSKVTRNLRRALQRLSVRLFRSSTDGGPPCGPLATVARSGMPNHWIALPDEPGGGNRIDLAVCSRRG